ncbi:MAG: hypothetical protein LBO74_10875, partial [Candidatus Symbiothrix sp.]|nr:hypothetical protein [Candidatus Symbiothrix sp.]
KPETICGEIFDELFKEIEVKRLKGENMEAYRSSELRYEDFYNFTSYAKQEGIIEGKIEGRREGTIDISRKLLEMGMPVSDIVKATGLTPKQIRQATLH